MNKQSLMGLGNTESNLQSNQIIKLLRTIGSPFIAEKEPFINGTESLELYDLAVKNKVSLLYLEALKRQGILNKFMLKYDEEYAKYLKILDSAGKVSKILDAADIEYVIFKTIKPYPAVPGDVDIVVLGDNRTYRKANEILITEGYREWKCDGISPTLPDLIDPEGDVIIDLQDELELSYVIYMDKNKFGGHTVEKSMPSGTVVKMLSTELNLAIVIIHSLTEYLYQIGEFYTFIYSLAKMNEREIDDFAAVLKENKITKAAKSFVTITAILHKVAYDVIPEKLEYILDKLGYEKAEVERLVESNFKVPHRYGASTMVKVILEKMKEKRFRRSVGVQIVKVVMNPKLTRYLIKEVIERQKRDYYLKELE